MSHTALLPFVVLDLAKACGFKQLRKDRTHFFHKYTAHPAVQMDSQGCNHTTYPGEY